MQNPEARRRRREEAARTFADARALAIAHGMSLREHTHVHYTLTRRSQGWRLEVYPGNRRLYRHDSAAGGRVPFLNLPLEWTLLDVVKAAAKT